MTTKQIKINEDTTTIPSQTTKTFSCPSPSKFVKGEFYDSDYKSDFEDRSQSTQSVGIRGYRPVRPPSSTPSGRLSANLSEDSKSSSKITSEFDYISKFDGSPYSKTETFEKEESIKKTHVLKPTPISAKLTNHKESTSSSSTFHQPSYTTRYYTAVAGAPFYNASLATETRNTMKMKESSETCNRIIDISQTKRTIHFDNSHQFKNDKYYEKTFTPISFASSPRTISSTATVSPKPRIQTLPTPTKFIPGEFRESDYENEIENTHIRPLWTPNPHDDEPRYRHVNPPRPRRATSLPHSYERIVSPLEFDNVSNTSSLYTSQDLQSSSIHNYQHHHHHHSPQVNRHSWYIPDKITTQAKEMNTTFHKKTNRFMEDLSKDLKVIPKKRLFTSNEGNNENCPQAYRDESRISEYGK